MLYMDFVLRVALSMVLGFLIGLERQLTGHPAGIRINVLICMGTSFFTLFPMLYGSDQVFRVGSSIISGVGFLCSGVIFKDSGSVRGMNTAATLWCTAAIGILASTRMYAMAVTAAVLLIGSNLILRPLARKVNPIAAGEENEKQYRISVTCQPQVQCTDGVVPQVRKLEYRNADADNDHACNHTQDAAQADFLTENIHMQNFLFCIARLEASPQGEPYEVIYNKYPVKCTPLSRVNLFKISHLTL